MCCLLSGQELNEILRTLSEITKELNALALYEGRKQSKKIKEEWIDGQQLMDILRIQRRTLQNLRDKGILPYTRPCENGKILYKASDIKKLLESNYTTRAVNQN